MVNNLSAQKNLPALRLAGFSYLVLFFLHLSGNASDQVISFSVLPQEHFLLDILGVPLVGMQSIRRDLVGLPLHFPQYCIEGHWQRLLSRNR